jgi:hypothetical protein
VAPRANGTLGNEVKPVSDNQTTKEITKNQVRAPMPG